MSRAPLALAVVVLVAAVAGGGAVGAASGPSELASAQDFDRVEFHVTVYDNGSARWTFVYKENLANESERQDFRAFAENFNNNDTALWTDFQDRASRLVREADNRTQRDMTATGFRKEATVSDFNRNLGLVRMSFLWTNCAVTDGDRVVLSDVFEGGLYVGPNQRLVVERGPGLEFRSVDPQPDSTAGETLADSDSVTWVGERSFSDERPRVVLGPPTTSTGTATDAGGGATTPDGSPTDTLTPGAPAGSAGWPLLLLALLVVGGFAAFAYRTGALGGPLGTDDDGGGDAGAGATTTADSEAAQSEPAIADEELLSDEDRVLQMLEERGGRMKQVNIVEETGWSKSKVSMLLSEMEEEEEVSKLRIGRENVISLPGNEPEAAGSPFDDDEE